MALTVDATVAKVVGRLRGKLAFVWMSLATDATNIDVTPAVADACWYFDVTPASYPVVADADLAAIGDPKRFVDCVTLETLYIVRGRFNEVDETAEKNSQKLDQFRQSVSEMITDLESRVPQPNFPRGSMGRMPSPLIPGVPPWLQGACEPPPCAEWGVW